MGKIFPLSEKPSCLEATLKLIEKSFQYKKPNSFEIDFAPLIDKSNHKNCFIMIDENENVLAHIGVKERFFTLNNKKFAVTLIGGIAVDEARRGEGIFQELFQDVLAEKRSDTALFLLWSDLEKLYNKYGFHLCGTQFELTNGNEQSSFVKTTYAALVEDERKQIRDLYDSSFAKTYITLERSTYEWEMISKITSADLYVQKHNGRIQSYYFQNKGQDLPGIIYEYGTKNDLPAFLKEISQYGKVWFGADFVPTEQIQYQFFMGSGDLRLFTDLIAEITNKQFMIRNINIMKQEVYFDFNEETLMLELPDFLRGVFGPGVFEELELKPVFLSGLDSI
jgi:predicted N-acetyltransferase YhbS